jgi:hypothetical protein
MGYLSYYTFGLPTFVIVVIGLYALFTGECLPLSFHGRDKADCGMPPYASMFVLA